VKATLSMGSVVVNIGAPDTRRYLKVGVEIGVTDARETKELEEHKAQILDLVISIFGAAPMEVLGSEEGRLDLKKTLLERIHEELRLEKVSRVYFTEFVIQ
jgi:flagellar protein FliL